MDMDEFQFVPPLFVLLFFGLGATMFVSPYFWLYQYGKGQTEASLSSDTMMNAARMLFVISLGSAIYNVTDPEASILGEIMIMVALIVYLSVYNLARKNKLLHVFASECANTAFTLIVTCLFMLMTFVFSIMLIKAMVVVNIMVAPIFGDPIQFTVLITGVVWISSLYMLSRFASKKHEEEVKTVQFHNVLWPLAIGLLLVMTPLVVEQMSRDGKFEPEPPRTILRKA